MRFDPLGLRDKSSRRGVLEVQGVVSANVTTVPSIISSMSGFVTSSTISFVLINLLLMMYLAAPFAIALLLFRDNEYIMYATMIMEGILWAIAVYAIVTKVYEYPKIVEGVLTNITKVAVNASG